ncbi:transcription elongation factor A [Striga asiatica]|uniref:Transcription elongation factor A n=1 Tax=Striga asiatica TaxID=4170 RepID=A0A5A7NX95_STRAF|nr:transcription elongation factor A [Striga asiatica]
MCKFRGPMDRWRGGGIMTGDNELPEREKLGAGGDDGIGSGRPNGAKNPTWRIIGSRTARGTTRRGSIGPRRIMDRSWGLIKDISRSKRHMMKLRAICIFERSFNALEIVFHDNEI